MIIIVMSIQYFDKKSGSKDWLNVFANYIVLTGVILNLVLRHLQKANISDIESIKIKLWTLAVWLLSCVLYVVADCIVLLYNSLYIHI